MIVTRYYEALNLRDNPFSLTPDPDKFFLMASHVEAMDTVLFALDNGVPMVRIYGDPGTGKTVLLKHLKGRLLKERGIRSVYVAYNPMMGPFELAESVLGFRPESFKPGVISEAVRRLTSEGIYVVLLDEAQDMGRDHFLFIKYLLDESGSGDGGRIFIVCAGTGRLKSLFEEEDLRPLAQRAPYKSVLVGLRRDELSGYIDYRLRQAGYSGEFPFSWWALRLIWRKTKGNPRRVNILAERSLLAAIVRGKRKVGRKEVKEAIRDLPEDV